MSLSFVITVSGSDASGAAGLQADNRAILATGAYPLNVVTALTLQTDKGVESMDVIASDGVRMHLLALLKSYPVSTIKAGMLGHAGTVQVLVDVLAQYPDINLVLDPVLRASSGRPLLDKAGFEMLVKSLVPRTFLLTPNIPELEALGSAMGLKSGEDEKEIASTILEAGCQAVLVKGGHREGRESVDRLYSSEETKAYPLVRIETSNSRGTGCALASYIAGGLATGLTMAKAVEAAKTAIHRSLQEQKGTNWPGSGPGFL